VEYVIQVNGKLRGSITVAKTENKETLEKLALQQPFVQKFIAENMTVRKVIVVPNKLINVVVS
jgi:leucyl-tRNA synthetase